MTVAAGGSMFSNARANTGVGHGHVRACVRACVRRAAPGDSGLEEHVGCAAGKAECAAWLVGPKVLLQALLYSAHNLIVVADDSCQRGHCPAAAKNTLLGVVSRRRALEAAAARAFASTRHTDVCPPMATPMQCLDEVTDSLGPLPGKRVRRAAGAGLAVAGPAGDAAGFYEAARDAAAHLLSPEVRQAAAALETNACAAPAERASAPAPGARPSPVPGLPIVNGRGGGQPSRAGMTMPVVGFGMGCGRLSEDRYEGVGEDATAARARIDAKVRGLVEHAIKAGYRLFDTAELYQNEHVLGEAMASSGVPRAEFFVMTKLDTDAAPGGEGGVGGEGADAELAQHVEETVAAQLARLRTAYIDAYMLHHVAHDLAGVQDPRQRHRLGVMLAALVRLRGKGKIRAIMHDVGSDPAAAAQIDYSLLQRGRGEAARLRGRGTAVVGITQFDGWPESIPPIRSAHVRFMARRYKRTAAQVILRWSVQSGVAAIPCSGNPAHITANGPREIMAFAISGTDMDKLNSLARAWANV